MANTYQLTINDIPEENKNLGLAYNQDGGSTQTLNIDGTNYKCTLKKISYKKAIYQPGEIHIELQVGKESNTAISFSEVEGIHNAFIRKFLQLQYTGKKTLNIAEDYYSFDVKIEKHGSGKPLTVQIQAFDPLKFLSLDKYCRAYTCKKLVTDIIINIDIWPNNLPKKLKEAITEDRKSITEKENDLNNKKKASNTSENDITEAIKELNKAIQNWWDKKDGFFVKSPQFITYATETENNSDNSSDPKKNYEFIQPYLVQYNESFLDFLVRVTNRCGEFFYYEGGKIHIGWKAKDPIIIQEYVSVKFPQEVHTAWDDKAIADIHNDYTQGKNLTNVASPKVMRDSELAFDENLAKIPPKEAYTSWQDFALFPGCFFVTNVTGALNSATLTEMIEFFIFNTTASRINSNIASIDTNNAYEKSNFDSDKPYFNERKNGNDLHPFSTNDTNKSVKSMTAYCLNFYTDIRNGIESAERSRLQIELGDHYCEVSLGSLIQFEGDTKQYIVVKIESKIDSQTDKLGLGGGETLSIEVILYNPDPKVTNYPPSAHVESMRSAKAQRAIITHNQDPLKMNRVRVRYPWQGETEKTEDLSKSEDSTPWIRIALPMASDGSGFNFLPEVGDEAIINYENGNIEKPYVEGMLYSSKKAVPASHKRNNARVLSSVNGHCIIFSDPGASTNAIKGLFPAWNTICSFYPLAKGALNDDVRKAMGGIELTDEYGLYSISMSSEKRAISVDSPLGKVEINAFTGITISAPNGNVRIEGKNIDIVAGNNLSISSGNNIASRFWHYYSKKGLKNSAFDFLADLETKFISKFELIDMGLIRTIIETFVRPIGGTLLIKSNRYLLMEAGKGETRISSREAFKYTSSLISKTAQDTTVIPNRIPTHISNFLQAIDTATESFNRINQSLLVARTAYGQAYNIIHGIPNHDRYISGLQDFNNFYNNNIDSFNKLTMQYKVPAGNPDYDNYQRIKTNLNILNENALKIQKENLTVQNIWTKFLNEILQDLVLRNIMDPLRGEIMKDNILNEFLTNKCFQRVDNRQGQGQPDYSIPVGNRREITYKVLQVLIQKQVTGEIKDEFYLNRKIQIPQAPQDYTQNWDDFCKDIIREKGLSNAVKNFIKFGAKPLSGLVGYDKLKGIIDQYIWDNNEDTGKILFSDQEGETLNFQNKEIHYYKKSVIDPIEQLKEILRRIQ